MPEKKVKYLLYETGQSSAPIPMAIAQALGWSHLTSLSVEIVTHNGKVGIFLSKAEEKPFEEEKEIKGDQI